MTAAWIQNRSIRLNASLILIVVAVAIVQGVIGALLEGPGLLEGLTAGFVFLATSCFFEVLLALALCIPIWYFGRHRISWTPMDHSVVVIPWATWALLVMLIHHDKSFVNVLVEGAAVGLAAPLSSLLRLAIGPRLRSNNATIASILVCVGMSAAIWAKVPFLGE
jgi:hypothetical protein